MGNHHRLSPSKAHQWLNCPKSVVLALDAEEKPNIHSATGTIAHNVAEECLTLGCKPENYLGAGATQDGFEIEIDQEMVDGVQLYVDYCKSLGFGDQDVESKVNLKGFNLDLYGTVDYKVQNPGRLELVDFKYGMSVVEVQDNPQLMLYALGCFESIKHLNLFSTTNTTIVQPRAIHGDGKIRTCTYKPEELLSFLTDEVHPAVQKLNDIFADLECVTGEWCKFCKAMTVCPEMEKVKKEMIAVDFPVDVKGPYDLTNEQIGEYLVKLELLMKYKKALEELAFDKAMKGEKIVNHKLVKKVARRVWISESEVKKGLLDFYGEIIYNKKLHSPAQMETAIKDKTVLKSLWHKPDTGLTLVHESNRRKEYVPGEEFEKGGN